jgi:hypothetical protein
MLVYTQCIIAMRKKGGLMDDLTKLYLKEIEQLKCDFINAENQNEKCKIMMLICVMSFSLSNYLIDKQQKNQELKKAA